MAYRMTSRTSGRQQLWPRTMLHGPDLHHLFAEAHRAPPRNSHIVRLFGSNSRLRLKTRLGGRAVHCPNAKLISERKSQENAVLTEQIVLGLAMCYRAESHS